MTYIEGFVLAVPTANKQRFIDHAHAADEVFMEHGARRILECWQDDVPRGETTDFYGAVAAKDDESVLFSWVEWADKATRDARMAELEEAMKSDERFDPAKNPMPFDGKRMIYGGFQPIVEQGAPTRGAYVQGFLLAVPEAKKEAYRQMAEDAWPFFRKHGALRLVEGWQDDVSEGKQTDFFRAVKAEPDEKVLFSFVEWASKDACQQAHEAMQSDPEMKMPDEMLFGGKRMIYGGFVPVVELVGEPA
jgi:uncharacterized protein YbaA (DUF1428 family)